jgi:hypothetical protein
MSAKDVNISKRCDAIQEITLLFCYVSAAAEKPEFDAKGSGF